MSDSERTLVEKARDLERLQAKHRSKTTEVQELETQIEAVKKDIQALLAAE